MKSQKYHIVGTAPKSNRKIVERGNVDINTCKYLTADFPGLIQALFVYN